MENSIDIILDAIENRTRREIIKRLILRDQYPLQLAKDLRVSQQAIMKHLEILEKSNIVKLKGMEKSDQGPQRKVYEINQSFLLTISLTPNFFEIRKVDVKENENKLENEDLEYLIGKLKETENKIKEIEKELVELVELKDSIVSKINEMVGKKIKNEMERNVLISYLSSLDIEKVSEETNVPEYLIKTMIDKFFED